MTTTINYEKRFSNDLNSVIGNYKPKNMLLSSSKKILTSIRPKDTVDSPLSEKTMGKKIYPLSLKKMEKMTNDAMSSFNYELCEGVKFVANERDVDELLLPINMPHQKMFINFIKAMPQRLGDKKFCFVQSILVIERVDLTYETYITYINPKMPKQYSVTFEKFDYREDRSSNYLVRRIIERINTSHLGEYFDELITPVNTVSPRLPSETNRVIVCKHKHNNYNYDSRPVNWLHTRSVRGHWRSINGSGNDRHGNKLDGITWVKPHFKGDGPLVIKDREFKED